MDFKDLVKKIIRYNKDTNIDLIESAYYFSSNILNDKLRASGEPWINHYLDVAYQVADFKLDDKAIAAALMHGILNKGADSKEIKKLFGIEIFEILENIERMSEIKKNIIKKGAESENLRKVLLAASRDLRALFIKICDKLVNLRDLSFLSEIEKKRIGKEALEIYAPLAYRLGMGKIKAEIEDLAFKAVDEKTYSAISNKVNKIRKDGERSIFKIKKIIETEIRKEDIKAEIEMRIKHVYSIYKKIIEKSYNSENLNDIIAFRIIVNSLDECYKTLRIIHSNFRPIPNRFKDYIAMPKPNGYQSLHTSVVDDEGRIFEVQIRTLEMHDLAEEGIASHFSYKKITHEAGFDKKLNWLKQVVNESNQGFNIDFFGDEVFAFTPKGKVVELPKGATVLDFAYSIHTDLGHHCIGANINGKFFSLKDIINNGDVLEVLESKSQKPNREWLKIIKTGKAKSKIRQYLIDRGKVVTRTYSIQENVKKDIGESLLIIDGDKKLKVKLAFCCKPMPGDKVIGLKTSNVRVMVHKFDCEEVNKVGKKKIKINWLENFKKPVKIIINAKDRSGLFKEIINSINKFDLKIEDTKGKSAGGGIECSFMANVGNLNKLNEVINRIGKIKDVNKVYISV